MPEQPTLPGLRDAMTKKVTRRELLLAEMDAVVTWGRLLALIAPNYPEAGGTHWLPAWTPVPWNPPRTLHGKALFLRG